MGWIIFVVVMIVFGSLLYILSGLMMVFWMEWVLDMVDYILELDVEMLGWINFVIVVLMIVMVWGVFFVK